MVGTEQVKGGQRQEEKAFRVSVGGKNTTKIREKEGEPQGTALFPACQVCLHHCCKWIESKVSKYAPGKDTEHLH